MAKDGTSTATPRLRFPEFREAETWERRRLSDLLIERKLRNRLLEFGPEEVLSVSGEYGCVNQIELLGRSYAGASVKDYHVVETGDLVYTKSPLKKNPFGIIKENKGKPGIVSTLYAVYRVTDIGHPAFLDHYFSSDYNLNSYLQPIVRKGAKNDMKVNNFAVLGGELYAPSVAEQKRIAAFLTSLDEVIAAQGLKVKALKAHKRGLIQRLFPRERENVPRVRFPEFHDGPEWRVKPFEELYEFKPTNTYARDHLNYRLGKVRNIHYGDIHTKFAAQFRIEAETVPFVNPEESLAKIRPDAYCKEGDMIFADSSEDLADVGKSIEILELKGEKVLSGSHTILARQKHSDFVIGFGAFLFKSRAVRAQIEKEAQGTKVMAISPNRLASVEICYPHEKSEQQRIADCLSSIDSQIDAETQKLDAFKTHKKGLVQQLFPSPEVD